MGEGHAPELMGAVLFTVFGAAVGLSMLGLARLATWWLGTARRKQGKLESYECGVPLLGSARARFGVRFYLIALLFILFDIETVFLLPYAVACRRLGMTGFYEVLAFVGVLGFGLFYLYQRGALDWED